MNLRRLLQNNSIGQITITNTDIRAKMVIAQRDLTAAKKIVSYNDADIDDTAYITAYNAILETGYALMFSRGYRVTSRGNHHLIVQQFVQAEFSSDFTQDELLAFGHGRQTRNTLQYDSTGVVSHPDVVDLVQKADSFVTKAKVILNIV